MILWRSVFEPVSGDNGMWKLAFPADEMRGRNLFNTYDTYAAHLHAMVHTLTLTPAQWNSQQFTEALLDFDLADVWLMQLRGGRWTDNECRIRFADVHDADMFKLFGVAGKVVEQHSRPGTIGFDPDHEMHSFRL